ncbi:MAG: 50S ribosomal protein L13 [Anaerolineae bacterium]|nr:50S ribosomal protein L13 [Anaerolineae bacterium]
MKTYVTKPANIQAEWWIVDATHQNLGRLASRIAQILRGKHKPYFDPSQDCGDYVIVINAAKVAVHPRHLEQKVYYRHSGYPGGLREIPLRRMLQTRPERVIEKAVWGMLPKNRLGRRMLKKLKVYAGPEHPHRAQQPKPLPLSASRD